MSKDFRGATNLHTNLDIWFTYILHKKPITTADKPRFIRSRNNWQYATRLKAFEASRKVQNTNY